MNNKFDDYQFSSDLEAFSHASYSRDKILRYSYDIVIHTILGTAILWKVFKLVIPLHSTNTEVRTYLIAVNCVNQFYLFIEYLGISYSDLTLLYESNTAVIALVKANKMTNYLHHINISMYFTCNEYNL